MSLGAELDTSGFAFFRKAFSDAGLQALSETFDREVAKGERSNVRALSEPRGLISPETSDTLDSVFSSLGLERPSLVRVLLFNKTGTANWFVPWHQDRTIAVKERHEINGFINWTRKDGATHVEPPTYLLESMVTLRVHLDDFDERNGALRVLPGSHNKGKLTQEMIKSMCTQVKPYQTSGRAGDVLIMRPLLVHSSARSTTESPRRILHLEWCSENLPAPLHWH